MLIALGSNATSILSECAEIVLQAVDLLEQEGAVIRTLSRLFRTPAFPAGSGPDFINAAADIVVPWSAGQAIAHLHAIEATLGRVRAVRWGQRTIDLDMLAMEGQVLPDRDVFQHWYDMPLADQMVKTPKKLILPHPRMHQRAFVLVPLLDVAPDWQHPVSGQSVVQMCAALSAADKAQVQPYA